MNALTEVAARISPAALMFVAEGTFILLAAILVQPILKRLPAARHAILLLALVSVGMSPAIVLLARHAGLPALIPDRDSPIQMLVHQTEAAAPVPKAVPDAVCDSLTAGHAPTHRVDCRRVSRRRPAGSRLAENTAHPQGGATCIGWGIDLALDRVAAVFGGPAPTALASVSVEVPMAGGWHHPVVLIPASLLPNLGSPELLHVLVHESAHVFRRDTLVKVYQQALASVLWFHPLVYVANRLLDSAREDLCDNYVLRVAAPDEYSRTLLAVAESFVAVPRDCRLPL